MKLLFALLLFCISVAGFSQQKQPNVLFFLVDDLGWNDIGTNGSKLYETPAIDALANEAVYFSNAYAAYPRCVPSRYAMVSGRHPARNGQKDGVTLPLEIVTIAEALKPAGYKTFYAGKWHLGHSEEFWPHNQGFDINKGGCDSGAPASYFFPYHDSEQSKNNKPYFGLETGKPGEYITDRLTDETIRFIEENNPAKTGKPFLAYLAHYAVHAPLQAKPDRIKYYNEKIKKLSFEGEPYIFGTDGRTKMWQDNAVYASMVESMDESLGKVIAKLKELGLYENTIIIFTSDNGGLSNSGKNNSRELATTNKPLRAGKGHIYEGGIKEPVFVRWPGIADKKAVTDIPITGMDYYPSILEMCGLPGQPQNHIDGVSFAPALKGEKMDENRPLFWHQVAARPDQTGDHNSSVIRVGNLKLHHFLDDNRIELYDLKADPFEAKNIAEVNKAKATELKSRLDSWKKEVGAAPVKEKATGTKDRNAKQNAQTGKRAGLILSESFEAESSVWEASGKQETKAKLLLTNDATDGKKAAVVIVSGTAGKPNSVLLTAKPTEFESCDSIEVSFFAKCIPENTKMKLQVQFESAEGERYFRAENFELTSTYKKYSVVLVAKPDMAVNKISPRFQLGETLGEYYFDNIVVKKAGNNP